MSPRKRIAYEPKAEELSEYVRSNSTGAGQSFVIDCRHCRDQTSISADVRTYRSDREKLGVANKFLTVGWRIEEGIPVCPACYKRMRAKGYYD